MIELNELRKRKEEYILSLKKRGLDNIEDNIVYNFANAIGFEENDEKKLTINYKKYNKFIKDYKIFDYEEYTKNIVINYENIYGYLNSLEQVFSSKTNIFGSSSL